MANWKRTTFPGVYFREHPTRKHGVSPDKYYSITYSVGREKEMGSRRLGESKDETKSRGNHPIFNSTFK